MNNSHSIFNINEENYNSSKSEIIGSSEHGRPLTVTYLGNRLGSSFRIFIIAGQHGNEKYARKAVNHLIRSLNKNFNMDFPLISLAILSDANPDGSSQRTRRNAAGVDLNRDHQRLDSEETRAIHSFVRSWRPHLIIDVHNYRSRRKHLLANNHIIYYDIFIDTPTNLAVHQPLNKDKINEFLKTIQSDLKSLNYSCERYTIVKPSGRVRHSTQNVIDARNSLSLRYNTLTVLLEGRKPTREEGKAGKEHIVSAQYQALYSILKWVQKHPYHFMDSPEYLPSEGDRIAVRSKYRRADHPLEIIFKNSITKSKDVVALSRYTPNLEVTKYIQLPTAYAVPIYKTKVIEILRRHGFTSQFSNPSKLDRVEYYSVKSVKQANRQNKSPRKISLVVKVEHKRLDSYIIFPISQEGGHSLAIFLEPESKYGLHRYSDLDVQVLPNSDYPILRVLE